MSDCLFCKIGQGEIPSHRVYEDEHTLGFFDIHPLAAYHTLVIPKKHYVNIFDIPEEELFPVLRAIKKITALYEEKLGMKDVQLINNSGAQAQQVVFHCHFHIIPRQSGDNLQILQHQNEEFQKDMESLLQKLH